MRCRLLTIHPAASLLLYGAVCLSGLSAGCGQRAVKGADAAPLDRAERAAAQPVPLDPAAARAALVWAVEDYAYGAVRSALPDLRDEPARQGPDSRVSIGRWQIDLAKRSFRFSHANRLGLLDIAGQFRRSQDGRWAAEITHTAHAHAPPPPP